MKKCIALLLFFYVCNASGQDCKKYYYMTNNAEVQITLFDADGSKTGLQTWKISNVTNDAGGLKSTVNVTMTDGKGQEISKGSGVYKCSGSKLLADVRLSMPQDQLQKNSGTTQAQVDNSYIEYPTTLSEGMVLPDAFFDLEVNTSGIPSTVKYEMKNRKVSAKEKISSDAGSWEAYKITYDAQIKIKMIGIGIPVVMKTIEWFVPNFGIVKSETYNKKGKLKGSSLLTKFK